MGDGKKTARKGPAEAKPSSSIVLISPQNEVLLLRRTATSSSFPDAFVFPGGNVSKFHEPWTSTAPDADCPAFRMAAIRETFEESGILLAVEASNQERMLGVSETETASARKDVHANKVKFSDWLDSVGGSPDTGNLHPCTRWITPQAMAKRFNTQMYIYLLPLGSTADGPAEHVPTADGGLEHTEAMFAPPREWLQRALDGQVVLFPPQLFLLSLVADHLQPKSAGAGAPRSLAAARESLVSYLGTIPADGVPWADKVITPEVMPLKDDDAEVAPSWRGKVMLSLAKPKGVPDKFVLVNFQRGGPLHGEVATREEVLGRPGMRERL